MPTTAEPDLFGDTCSLRLLINAVIDYDIYMIDLDGRMLTWNAGAVRLKGYSAEEIVGGSAAAGMRGCLSETKRANSPTFSIGRPNGDVPGMFEFHSAFP